MKRFIFIHGFLSTGSGSDKLKILWGLFGDESVDWIDYPSESPVEAISIIKERVKDLLQNNPELILIGSSLGGFYSELVSKELGCKAVLINPAIEPHLTIKKIVGDYTNDYHIVKNFHTGKSVHITNDTISELEYLFKINMNKTTRTNSCLVLLDRMDEVIDSLRTQELYNSSYDVVMFEGGNHSFSHLKESKIIIEGFENNVCG